MLHPQNIGALSRRTFGPRAAEHLGLGPPNIRNALSAPVG
jgi:hypothetical protein